MDKIIASEIEPHGIDNELLTAIYDKYKDLKDGVLYYGFPVFKDYEDQPVRSKISILSKNCLILISTTDHDSIEEDDENLTQLFNYVETSLRKSKILRITKSQIALPIESFLFASQPNDDDFDNEIIPSIHDLNEKLDLFLTKNEVTQQQFNEARSIIEGSKALTKLSKRTKKSSDPKSRLNILIKLEKEVSNFDIEQRKTAISLINGPQRIRGLAGSGKTIVLAMKAAHIHLQHPGKRILFTFYTKSLYDLIKESIARFYRHFAGDEPNWEYIDILHSWGGKSIDGVYYNACMDNSISPMSFPEAKRLNSDDPFKEVCSYLTSKKIREKYDYILIDEAQDLPNEFFRICYDLSKGKSGSEKNIVWAYDELQSIFNIYQRTPAELFGTDEKGTSKVDLEELQKDLHSGQSNDLVLFKCYRNPLEVLLTAHALGFGIYSDQPVQMLENKDHWIDFGYRIEDDQPYEVGKEIKITRDRENSPLTIYDHQSTSDIIQTYKASDIDDECKWIVQKITSSIADGLKPHDILVVCLDDRNAKNYFRRISLLLSSNNIRSNNLLTSTSSAPPFMLDEMVTLSTVHRAKGNEASEVFAIGLDAIYPTRKLRSGRNKIFTAFTRTKAWLKVTGVGDKVEYFFNEIKKSIDNSPSLIFTVPDRNEIETIQRDLNSKPTEMKKFQDVVATLVEKGYTKEEIQMELNLISKGDS